MFLDILEILAIRETNWFGHKLRFLHKFEEMLSFDNYCTMMNQFI